MGANPTAATGGKMAKYRKKPVIVEATQWFPDKKVEGVKDSDPDCYIGGCCYGPHVHTIHNNAPVKIEPGDWIITEPDGIHYYPCKPDIFANNYEEVK